MHGLAWLALIVVVSFAVADSVPYDPINVEEGSTFKVELVNRKGAKGFQRGTSAGTAQTFWVCDGTNKDKCGAWVDDKGKKIPGASKTTVNKDNVLIIENATFKDSAWYQALPANGNSKDVLVILKPRF